MTDREKVIKAYEDFINGYECFCTSDDYEYEMHKAVLALLKEQEYKDRMFHALEDDWKAMLKEQEEQKFFVDESGKITPLPIVIPNCPLKEYEVKAQISDAIHETAKQFRQTIVRCKDCRNGGIDTTSHPHYWCSAHSEYHEADWFCADGERKKGR